VSGTDALRQRLAAILAADAAGYSRLMAADERGTVAALDAARVVFREQVEAHHGRVIDMAGDSVLAVFETATGAVAAALAVQQNLDAASGDVPEDRRMRFRIGVHLGEIIEKFDGTVYGDGVNIAARLENLSAPGGVMVSDSVRSAVKGKVSAKFEDLGEQLVKNIIEPVRAFRVQTPGRTETGSDVSTHPKRSVSELRQQIRFCTSTDGVRIAYAVMGEGAPFVWGPHFLTHLEFDLTSPVWRPWLVELSRHNTFIRYDARGCGLSDREITDLSFDASLADLKAVVDASRLDRFALFGASQGASAAIAYAARHPERITHLVIYGGYLRGPLRRNPTPEQTRALRATLELVEVGWGLDNPAYRQLFTSIFIPDATPEQAGWFNEHERTCTTPEMAARLIASFGSIDVTDLASKVRCPTLVLHARGDLRVPFEEGRMVASLIAGARFVPLEGRNHVVLEGEPAFAQLFGEIQGFLASGA